MTSTLQNPVDALIVPDAAQIEAELMPKAPPTSVKPELAKKAEEFVGLVMSYDPKQAGLVEVRTKTRGSLEGFGNRLQEESASKGALLSKSIRDISAKGQDGGPIATALVDLSMELDELDPAKFDLSPGFVGRMFGWLPFVGNPAKRYFLKYESAEDVIDGFMESLRSGKATLAHDNIDLELSQDQMRKLTIRLEDSIQLGQLIDARLKQGLDEDDLMDDEKRKFIMEELQFPLRQRIMDLQQQLVVNKQGVVAMELIIRNNKELMKGVDRCLNVTITAMRVAVTVAMALANQKIVLEKIAKVTQVTNKFIAYTSNELKTVGTEIHKQASSASLDINVLKQAFADIRDAMEDISTYRQKALPDMAQKILEMDQLASDAEKAVQRMELGNQSAPQIMLEV